MSNNYLDDAETVAHYTKLEHVADILYDKRLLLSPVKNLADPREIPENWIITGGIGELHKASQLLAERILSDAKHQIRLLCTLRDEKKHEHDSDMKSVIEDASYSRPRMWAQYGDKSKGFCVVLDRKLLDNEVNEVVQKTEHMLSEKVTYPSHLGKGGGVEIEHGPDHDPTVPDIFETLNKNNNLDSIYFRKARDWEHEYEHRWLLYDPKLEPIYVPIGGEGVVKAVVLGCNFPCNQISQVQLYCKDLNCRLFGLVYTHPEYKLTDL